MMKKNGVLIVQQYILLYNGSIIVIFGGKIYDYIGGGVSGFQVDV